MAILLHFSRRTENPKADMLTLGHQGLGRAIAVRYAKEGARVVCADLVPTARAAVETEAQPTHELLAEK